MKKIFLSYEKKPTYNKFEKLKQYCRVNNINLIDYMYSQYAKQNKDIIKNHLTLILMDYKRYTEAVFILSQMNENYILNNNILLNNYIECLIVSNQFNLAVDLLNKVSTKGLLSKLKYLSFLLKITLKTNDKKEMLFYFDQILILKPAYQINPEIYELFFYCLLRFDDGYVISKYLLKVFSLSPMISLDQNTINHFQSIIRQKMINQLKGLK